LPNRRDERCLPARRRLHHLRHDALENPKSQIPNPNCQLPTANCQLPRAPTHHAQFPLGRPVPVGRCLFHVQVGGTPLLDAPPSSISEFTSGCVLSAASTAAMVAWGSETVNIWPSSMCNPR